LDGGTGASDGAGARKNLGLVIGTNVQAYDATLTSIALLGTAADKIAYTTGVDTWAETGLTAFGRSIIDDADEATFKATVNLEIGTDVQAYSANLGAIAALAVTDGNIIVGNGSTWVAESGATARTSLGLGNVENTALSTWAGSSNLTTLGTVTSGTLSTGAVLGGVTMTLGSDADGDMYYRSSNVLTRLAKGTSLQQLRMNSGATAPEWFTPSTTSSQLQKSFTAGEDISAGEAVRMGTDTFITDQQNTIGDGYIGLNTNVYAGQSFTTGVGITVIDKFQVYLKTSSGTFSGTVTWELWSDSGGNPSSLLETITEDYSTHNVTTSAAWHDITPSSPISVSASTKYWLLSHNGGANPQWYRKGPTGTTYAGGNITESANGSTWFPNTSYDYAFKTMYQDEEAGKIYLADAASAGNAKPIGFADEAITNGNSGNVNIGGVDDNQSGLTPATVYYLSDTPGAIGTSAGSTSVKVGFALSATELLISELTWI